MKVYVAASWRTTRQPMVVAALRMQGHEVYDFRQDGFSWAEISPTWTTWNADQYLAALETHHAQRGFDRDKAALDWCDACVLVLPSGRSAHLEMGYAIGQHKVSFVLLDPEEIVPDLMYLLATYVCTSLDQLLFLTDPERRRSRV